jgi:ABC-type Fe3+-hydroxamate transport system substrate-binding protein
MAEEGMRVTCGILFLLALPLGTSACSRPAASGGQAAARSAAPHRIVSIVPAVTEMLFAIGAGPQVAGVSSFDTWPPEVASLPKVGALLDPDFEQVIRLRPDLVIVYGTESALGAKLARAGIRTYPYVMGGLANLTRTMRELGRQVGRPAQAASAADAIAARLEAIRQRVAGWPRPRTLLVFGREPGALRAIDASGGVGFLADIVTLAGGDNVLGGEQREAVRIDTETILAAAPEIVIDLHYGRALSPEQIDRERAAWRTLPALPAVRDGRVALLVGDEFVVPGPRLADAAEAIADVIHPVRRQ